MSRCSRDKGQGSAEPDKRAIMRACTQAPGMLLVGAELSSSTSVPVQQETINRPDPISVSLKTLQCRHLAPHKFLTRDSCDSMLLREHVLLVILLKSLRHSIMIHWWNRRGNVREQCHHCLPYVRLSHPWPKCGAMTAMMINTVSYGMDGGTWDLGPCDISELQEPGTTSSV
ncbi:uncharacterized protein LOC131896659 isoform X2 [Peromyscus eremicus]|uniref:uncharacterized protein LOC131896659 isoform X2 n=1 Tax=Peromyscus eremicus TaxID=42410 RepID=UPI0027DDCD8F|nr:uncharacterized protein LOC131896659 isoform X2 [Peromyscus eremicus]